MKKTIILVGIILLLIVACSVYYFSGTPTYSLYKIKRAVSQHDSAEFNKYVDVDRVVSSLIEQATSSLENDEELKDNPFKELATSILSSMRDQIKNEINKSVEEISEGKSGKFSSVKIENIEKEGKAAKIKLKNSDGDEINLNMIQTPQRYWKIVGIDFEDFKKINPIKLGGDDSDSSSDKEENKKISSTSKFGEKASINGGWFITIQKPEPFIPDKDSFNQPKKGNKFVSVEMEYSNESSKEAEVDPSNLTLKDGENHVYETYIFGGKKPELEDSTLVTANDKVKGFATFEVSETSEITRAIYANDKATVIFEL